MKYTSSIVRSAVASSGLFLIASCGDAVGPTAALQQTPAFHISDAAHRGRPHFFFLPPLVADPVYSGVFDPSLSPVVEICAWTANACVSPLLARYTDTSGPGSESVRVDLAEEHYIVNWHTDEFDLDPALTYRIRVLAGGIHLGFVDVDLVNSARELKNVDTDNVITLVNGRTLPVKFRIERGAVPVCAAVTDGLISWWPAEGDARDLISGNDGILRNGATFGPGRVGSAFSLDGIDDFVEVPDAASLKPAHVSVEFWFRSGTPFSTGTFAPLLYKIGEDDDSGGIDRGYDFYFDFSAPSGPSLVFRLPRDLGSGMPVFAPLNVAADTWHHVAGTYDQQAMRLYVDGELLGREASDFPIAYTPAPILLGRLRNSAHAPGPVYLRGLIDELSVYNRALTAQEVQQIVAAGDAGKCKP